jgi:phospholipid/cholesterol/gamma-HCH transport system ATP-binding protein
MPSPNDAVAFDDVSMAFDDKVVLEHASFAIEHGHMLVLLGASGAGKSTVLRLILGLLKPDAGQVLINGQRIDELKEADLMKIRADIGMVFQEGAIFDSLTVRENTGYRLYEQTDQPIDEIDQRVQEVLSFVELNDLGERMPAELSGGQRRRVGIARAIASKPKLVLYDEPTTGLDPITAVAIDDEIVKLRDIEQVTSIVVTHQLRDAFYVASHTATRAQDGKIAFSEAPADVAAKTTFLMIKDGKVLFSGSAQVLRESSDPYLKSFLS